MENAARKRGLDPDAGVQAMSQAKKRLQELSAQRQKLRDRLDKAEKALDDLRDTPSGPFKGPITGGNDAMKQQRIDFLNEAIERLKKDLIDNMDELDELM